MAATIQISNQSAHQPRTHADNPDNTVVPGRCAGTRRQEQAVYARRRLLVGLALVLAGAVVWTLATWATNSAVGVSPVGADRTGTPQEIYVVQPGDTLWSIAAELDTDGDVRDTVDRLAKLNGGSALSAGQRLVLGG